MTPLSKLIHYLTAATAALMVAAPPLKPRAQHLAPTISIMRASGVLMSKDDAPSARELKAAAESNSALGSFGWLVLGSKFPLTRDDKWPIANNIFIYAVMLLIPVYMTIFFVF